MFRVFVIWGCERVLGFRVVFIGIILRVVFINGVKIGGVYGVVDFGNVGGWLFSDVIREVNGVKEWMSF